MTPTIFTLAFEVEYVKNYRNSEDPADWLWAKKRVDLGSFDSMEEARKARYAVKGYHEEMGFDFDEEECRDPSLSIYSETGCGDPEKLEEAYPL